jgi:hypothetical protein
MKSLVVGLGVAAAVAALGALPDTPPVRSSGTEAWPDLLTLANGTLVRCRIRSASSASLTIEYPRRGATGDSPLSREVPWSGVRAADFSMDDEFHRLLSAADPVRETPRLAARWSVLAPMLGRPNHPAGELGLALARLSLNHPEHSARHRALDVCRAVAANDWLASRRHHARLLQAKLLAALGRADEAAREARQLAGEAGATPEAAMPALVMAARADFASLRTLEEENPKWSEDDSVRPQREALFHQALDAALKPSLFFGALEEPASDGLWTAVEVLEFAAQVPAAADTARDLIRLYPAAPRAADAAAFLRRHRLPLDPEAAPEAPPAPTAASAATAPPPTAAPPATEPAVLRRPRYAPAVPKAAPATHGPTTP